MKRLLIGVLALFLTFSVAWTHAEGLLPSLTEAIGKPMPSYGEALECYPDNETSNDDGSVTEQYINVSEEQFNTFSVYLEKEGATLQEYTVDNGILTATILADDATFFFQYDSQKSEVIITYPKGTYDERLERIKQDYQQALALYDEGKYEESYTLLLAIKGYIPADNMLKEDKHFVAIRKERIAAFKKVGGTVFFGAYEQDNDLGNGKEPIEWRVLDIQGSKVLLISEYLLEGKPYNTSKSAVTWKTCSLRKWLNNDFFGVAFSEEEKNAISITKVDNSSSKHTVWRKDGGEDTEDQVFLLCYAEANKYLKVTQEDDSTNTKAIAEATEYAANNGAGRYSDGPGKKGGYHWWLRMPGGEWSVAGNVNRDGGFSVFDVNSVSVGVRPCIWVDLDSEYFEW